jgi:hypothetical protein
VTAEALPQKSKWSTAWITWKNWGSAELPLPIRPRSPYSLAAKRPASELADWPRRVERQLLCNDGHKCIALIRRETITDPVGLAGSLS